MSNVPTTVQKQEKAPPSAPSSQSASAPSRSRLQLKAMVSGKSFDEQIQMLTPGGAQSTQDVHAAAAHGLSGGGGALPFSQQIQQSFGGHDVGNIQAHVGGKAADASAAMGAEAYASGDSVAFASSPSLHTAAHEAAHIVQQRAGVSLSGGVGQAGDSYEKNADAVADRVVRGESAADLLPAGGGAAGGVQKKSVQRFAGNVDTATTHQGEGTVREQVTENFGEGPAGARDTNFNPAIKVEFETLLGRALIHAREFYDPVVKSVSLGIYRYLQAKADTLKQQEQQVLEQAYSQMSFMFGANAPQVFYGRIADSAGEDYNKKMTDLLQGGGGTVQNHMLAHQCFLDHILDADGKGDAHTGAATQYFDKMRAKAKEAGEGQYEGAKNPDLKHLREDDKNDVFGEKGPGVNDMTARGRLNAGKGGTAGFNTAKGGQNPEGEQKPGVRYDARIADRSLRSQGSTGITAEENKGNLPALNSKDKEQGLGQVHSRGLEQYTLDESQKFIQDARVKYNMPLAAGISGTTTDLHEVAKMMGVTGPQNEFKYQLACIAHLGTAGAHSFHEIMAAAAINTSVQYEPGNYRSILRYGAENIPGVKALFDDPKYSKIPGIGDLATTTAKVKTGHGSEQGSSGG